MVVVEVHQDKPRIEPGSLDVPLYSLAQMCFAILSIHIPCGAAHVTDEFTYNLRVHSPFYRRMDYNPGHLKAP
ncbi:MAG: hypothetical protein ACUVXB_17215 [Bryobacteraceae bacterium]